MPPVLLDEAGALERPLHDDVDLPAMFHGLDHVVPGPFVDRRNRVAHVAGARHDDHRRVRARSPQRTHQVDAAHLGHAQIGQHEIRRSETRGVEGVAPVGRDRHLVAQVFQIGLEIPSGRLLIVNDEDAPCGGHASCLGFVGKPET